MAIEWTAIESALESARTAPELLAALTGSHAVEIEQMLDRIGASEAAGLLLEAQHAPSEQRRDRLTACLASVDKALAAGGQADKRALTRLGRRRRDQAAHFGDLAQCALLASLIDVEVGGEPDARRSRFAGGAMALETHIAAVRESASSGEAQAQAGCAREVFVRIGRFVRAEGG